MHHTFFSALLAQAENGGGANILTPNGGLMVWTLVIFLILLVVLSKYAFKPIIAAVAAREKALEDAIENAKRDREEAAKVLAEARSRLDAVQGEGQKVIADARAAAEEVRLGLIEQTRQEQQAMLERAKAEIARERDMAIAELRREAVDLAIIGASKVIEKNLDDRTNRDLVEKFLASLGSNAAKS